MYWTVHLEGGPRRVNHAAAAVGDFIYSFGGFGTGENYKKRRPMDIHVLNTGNLRWSLLPLSQQGDDVPFQRYGHTAVAYEHKIYILGGRNDESTCNKVFCFDTVTKLWSCPEVTGVVPSARDGHSACLINHCMYVFGGFEEENSRFSNDVYYLDLRTMKWHYLVTVGEVPKHRDFHSATAIGSRMYVFGGRRELIAPDGSHDEDYCSDIIYLDTHTDRWHRPTTRGEIPLGRRSHSAFTYDNFLYVFGGYNGTRDQHYNDLHRFDPVTNKWKLVNTHGKVPICRRRQSCLVVKGKVYLFGGTCPDSEVNNSWPYTDDYQASIESDQFTDSDAEDSSADHEEEGSAVDDEDVADDEDEDFFDCVENNEPLNPVAEEDEDFVDYVENDPVNPVVDGWDIDSFQEAKLMDLNDLHVLDFSPSLYTLCMMKVIGHKLDWSNLPEIIRREIHSWSTPNTISH